MKNETLTTEEINELIRSFKPITIENVGLARQALIDAGVVLTHKMAQEVYIVPIQSMVEDL